jgi:prokaryotic ubiquitin-like protein Pup
MNQVRAKPAPRKQEPEPEPAPTETGTDHVTVDEIDAILDEIDAVLEENAEDFVHQYIQKGGQ